VVDGEWVYVRLGHAGMLEQAGPAQDTQFTQLRVQQTVDVDIGAAEYIHRQLIEERSRGTAILVISEDLDEVMIIADRIAVMFEGRLIGILDREDVTVEQVGLLMAGSVA